MSHHATPKVGQAERPAWAPEDLPEQADIMWLGPHLDSWSDVQVGEVLDYWRANAPAEEPEPKGDPVAELSEVRRVADQAAGWQTALQETVRAALASGASITDVATAARVTRQTIYRWRDDRRSSYNVRDTLNEALELILEVGVPESTAADLAAGINADQLEPKARRLNRGIAAIGLGIRELDEDQRLTLTRAIRAASAVRVHGENTYQWLTDE